MSDLADRAQVVVELLERLALAAQLRAGCSPPSARKHCSDCGECIPTKRRAAVPGAQRCTPCQAAKDRRPRHFAGRAP